MKCKTHLSAFSESISTSGELHLVTAMGQTLTEPITTKETSHISNDAIHVGCSSMQGWRISILLCSIVKIMSLFEYVRIIFSLCSDFLL